MFDNLQGSLADVTTTPHHFDDGMDWDFYLDLDFDFYDEPDEDEREPYYHGLDMDDEEDVDVVEDVDHDPNEIVLPFIAPVSRDRHARTKSCPYGCCLGAGLRPRHRPKYNSKPRRKDHRG